MCACVSRKSVGGAGQRVFLSQPLAAQGSPSFAASGFPFPRTQISGFPFKIVKIQLSCLLAFFFVAPLLYFLPGTTFAIWYWYWSLRAHRVRHHNSSHSYRRAAPPTKAPYLTPVLAFQPSSHFTTRLLARSLFPSLTITIYYIAGSYRSHRGETPTMAKGWPCGPRWWW